MRKFLITVTLLLGLVAPIISPAPAQATGAARVTIARREVGYLQGQRPYATTFWCREFVNWVFARNGIKLDGNGYYSEFPAVDPQPGDIVRIDLEGKHRQVTHAGIVEWVNATTVGTIEGNVLGHWNGDPNYHDGVWRRSYERTSGYIMDFRRPPG